VYVALLHHTDSWWGGKERKVKVHKYTMAGRRRSSRMNEGVIEEGLKRGIVEMGDEMKGLLWKIERSRDNSQEGLKSTVP
jgi:hypothetical protein